MTRPEPRAVGRRVWRGLRSAWWRRRLRPILTSPAPPATRDSDDLFRRLQRAYPPRDDYRYGAADLWRRATGRVDRLLALPGLREPGKAVLEAGCGDGMTGAVLGCYGHTVTLTDIEDWRDDRARGLAFLRADLCAGLDLPAGAFDLVCSYNTFEHLADPARALAELIRVCRPGGLIHLKFGPLYASAWGLHAYQTLTMPYPQFLFSPAFVAGKVRQLGVRDLGRDLEALQPLNRWRARDFARLWAGSGCAVIASGATRDLTGLRSSAASRAPSADAG